MIFFCLGLPFAIWSAARTSHEGSAAHRRLVHVLTWVYNDDCWYMESLDLLRKFALSGVVSITWRDERAQLLFGCFVCLVTPPARFDLHARLPTARTRLHWGATVTASDAAGC